MSTCDVLAARRPLFFHAHPDDETLSTGGLMALLARAGAHVSLVTATRGERGEVVPGPLKFMEGTAELEVYREGELRAALRALGTPAAPIVHSYLGVEPARAAGLPATRYLDSGMVWGPQGLALAVPDAPVDALTRVPLDQEVADLVAAVRSAQADVVVSYGSLGGYGHPDHRRCAEVAARAAAVCALPAVAALSDAELAELPASQRAHVARVDAFAVAGAVEQALRAYGSQLTVVQGATAGSDGGAQAAITVRHCGGQLEVRRLTEYYVAV